MVWSVYLRDLFGGTENMELKSLKQREYLEKYFNGGSEIVMISNERLRVGIDRLEDFREYSMHSA